MSYIRSLSNPEGLYVYGSGKGVLLVWESEDEDPHIEISPELRVIAKNITENVEKLIKLCGASAEFYVEKMYTKDENE